MYRFALSAGLLVAAALPAQSQSWVPWHQPNILEMYKPDAGAGVNANSPSAKQKKSKAKGSPAPAGLSAGLGAPGSFWWSDDDEDEDKPAKPQAMPKGPAIVEGGPKPDLEPRSPKTVEYQTTQKPGTVVIDTAARRLYLVRDGGQAYVYPVSVGREGFAWAGEEKISRMASWPDWHPPAEMRQRDPKLPVKMTGGLWNPLGAKALYLGNTLYRIHGTSDARSIGRAASSGCFRMHNRHVVDLAQRVGIGTKVVVINASPNKTASAAR